MSHPAIVSAEIPNGVKIITLQDFARANNRHRRWATRLIAKKLLPEPITWGRVRGWRAETLAAFMAELERANAGGPVQPRRIHRRKASEAVAS